MQNKQYTKEEMLEALKKASDRLTPLQHFQRMVDIGLIDKNGKVLWDRESDKDNRFCD